MVLDHEGNVHELTVGDIIGRLPTAALRFSDPRISEAHALVSLRGQDLKLLALRGSFVVRKQAVREVSLTEGLKIELAPGLGFEVQTVMLPDSVLAIQGPGLKPTPLTGTCSLQLDPVQLEPGYAREASAWLWEEEGFWTLRVGEEPPEQITAGQQVQIGGQSFTFDFLDLGSSGEKTTHLGGEHMPLTIETRWDSVHFRLETGSTFVLNGVPARIFSELATIAAPVGWEPVAREIWPDTQDVKTLRTRWDNALARLRRKLRTAGIRTSLLRSDRGGNIELVLGPNDELVDRA